MLRRRAAAAPPPSLEAGLVDHLIGLSAQVGYATLAAVALLLILIAAGLSTQLVSAWLLRRVGWVKDLLVGACASFLAAVLTHQKVQDAFSETFTKTIVVGVHELLVNEDTPAHLRAAYNSTMPAEPLYEVGQQAPAKVLAFVRGLIRGLLPLNCLSSMERCVKRTTGHGTRRVQKDAPAPAALGSVDHRARRRWEGRAQRMHAKSQRPCEHRHALLRQHGEVRRQRAQSAEQPADGACAHLCRGQGSGRSHATARDQLWHHARLEPHPRQRGAALAEPKPARHLRPHAQHGVDEARRGGHARRAHLH